MTATRGAKWHNPAAYYATPDAPIVRAIDAAIEAAHNPPCDAVRHALDVFTRLEDAWVLDPSCGGCAWDDRVPYRDVLVERYGVRPERVLTIDIREDSRAEIVADFLTWESPPERFDLCVTNPPFYLAVDFVERAWPLMRPGGAIVMLQRISWMGSAERRGFFERFCPQVELYDPQRISFRNRMGSGDNTEYSHFVFPKGLVCRGDTTDPRAWSPRPSTWTFKRTVG